MRPPRFAIAGVSEVVKDSGSRPDDQVRPRVPRNAETRSKIVLLWSATTACLAGASVMVARSLTWLTVNGSVPLGDEGAPLYSQRRP